MLMGCPGLQHGENLNHLQVWKRNSAKLLPPHLESMPIATDPCHYILPDEVFESILYFCI